MRDALRRLRAALHVPPATRARESYAALAVLSLLLAFSILVVGHAWWDYFAARPGEDTVVHVVGKTKKDDLFRCVWFERGAAVMCDTDSESPPGLRAIGLFSDLLLNEDRGLKDAQEGDRVTVWHVPRTGKTLAAHRMPLALSAIALTFSLLFLMNRRRGESPAIGAIDRCLETGRILAPGEVEVRTQSPSGKTTLRLRSGGVVPWGLLLASGAFGLLGMWAGLATFFVGLGTWFSFLDPEGIARMTLALTAPVAAMLPLLVVTSVLTRRLRISWTDSRIWVNWIGWKRSAIQRVALRASGEKPVLEIMVQGWDQPVRVEREPLWVASILERLGYRIGYTEGRNRRPDSGVTTV